MICCGSFLCLSSICVLNHTFCVPSTSSLSYPLSSTPTTSSTGSGGGKMKRERAVRPSSKRPDDEVRDSQALSRTLSLNLELFFRIVLSHVTCSPFRSLRSQTCRLPLSLAISLCPNLISLLLPLPSR